MRKCSRQATAVAPRLRNLGWRPVRALGIRGRVAAGEVWTGAPGDEPPLSLEHLGWQEAADLIYSGIEKAISTKRVTYDFERLMEGATLLKCSEFGDAIISNMD